MFTYENIKALNDLELSVYNYIMDNKEKVKYMKIRDLANEVHVSTTTILNFCKKVGCDGYTEFKVKFKDYLLQTDTQQISEDTGEIIDFLKKSSSEEFEAKITTIANEILKAKRTVFIGSSMSGIVAKYGARYLSSVGEFSLFIDDPYYPTTGEIYEDSVIVVCSVSGETNDIIDHMSRFKNKRCTIISITDTENSTISKLSDINISYYVSMIRIGRYDITSQIPAMSIIERVGKKIYNQKKMEF
jgi:DNA-binding MurR/RpiR family transcriptional regulator